MAKSDKVVDATKQKINPQTVAKTKKLVDKVANCLAKLAGAIFFIATSYAYVSGWLKVHQSQHDLSVAGGILVVSIALFLYTRKR